MSMRTHSKKSVLLFNPWIYDFAAYDFWFKPLGLLSIGAVLRQLGYHVELVDCLDRFHPVLIQDKSASATDKKRDGSGKFIRSEIQKPTILGHVPRKYCRYGMPLTAVDEILENIEPPDFVLVASFMSYWYPAVADAVRLLRQRFPKAIIVLGGIYATLAPDHARTFAKPDYVITGEGEIAVARLLAQLAGGAGHDFNFSGLDELPWPAMDLYSNLASAAILTSRGCPFSCSFCASKIVAPHYRRRSPENVLEEIRYWHERFGVDQFAFFDDALLLRSDDFIKPILFGLLKNKRQMSLHTPNGLAPRYIDQETADLFFSAGVRTVRLSFETSNLDRQAAMSAKVTNQELASAVAYLERAGYKAADIGVYVMMGLPDQAEEEVIDSIDFVHSLGAGIYLASFSPIPGTKEWSKAIAKGLWNNENDLLLTNTSIYPLWTKTIGYQRAVEIDQYAKNLNQAQAKSRSSCAPSLLADDRLDKNRNLVE